MVFQYFNRMLFFFNLAFENSSGMKTEKRGNRIERSFGAKIPIAIFTTMLLRRSAAARKDSSIDDYSYQYIPKRNFEPFLNRPKLQPLRRNCTKNSAGCKDDKCWTNCGPRLSSDDWCFTTKNQTTKRDSIEYVTCKNDTDCDKCWPCANSCVTDDDELKAFISSQFQNNSHLGNEDHSARN